MLEVGASEEMKTGRKIPIPNKSKDQKVMNNYRGILISSTLSKIFESLILKKNGTTHQSSLQIGFTNGLTPLMAAVCLTEAGSESKATAKNLHVATLDTRKAFDVVSHPILMAELSETQMPNDLWRAILDLYEGMTEKIEWDGTLSRPVRVQQAVRQGRTLQPCTRSKWKASYRHYKSLAWGCIFLGSPTVPDDVFLADQKHQTLRHVAKMKLMLEKCLKY